MTEEIQEENKQEPVQVETQEQIEVVEEIQLEEPEEITEVEYEDNSEEEKKVEMTQKERELALYALASDVGDMRAIQAEAEAYANTTVEMGDNNERNCADGVVRGTEYYREMHFKYKFNAKSLQVQINRLMLERGITIDELNEFMNNVINPKEPEEE